LPTVVSAGPPLNTNVLTNPGFEDATSNGWIGTYSRISSSSIIAPYSGSYSYGTTASTSTIRQDIDLVGQGYDVHRLDTGGYKIDFGGTQYAYNNKATLMLTELSTSSTTQHSLPSATSAWTTVEDSFRLTENTRILRYTFNTNKITSILPAAGTLDETYAKVSEYDIWTSGGIEYWLPSTGKTYDTYASTGDSIPATTFKAGVNGADGQINVTNGATFKPTAYLGAYIGYESGRKGTVNLDGGIWNGNTGTQLGRYGTGEINITNGGKFTSDSHSLTVSGGSTVNLDGGTMYLGGGIISQGVLNFNNGIVTINDDSRIENQALTIGSQGTLNITGGNVQLKNGLNNMGKMNVTG